MFIVGTKEWRFQKVEEIIRKAELKEVGQFEQVYIGTMEPEKTTTRGHTEEINRTENLEEAQVRGTMVIVRRQSANDPVHNQKLKNEVIFPMRLWTLVLLVYMIMFVEFHHVVGTSCNLH